ncbi:hypothetical protein L195_g033879 [Trifolium pratense]|uniref:Uncharacterized protein n=1 Tax=Trifolium pratense TaxID=57577 RepID=A0A2K3LH92_TRIPR|nr:hypothetical protein L195_g033879 [Trifolium pratense]
MDRDILVAVHCRANIVGQADTTVGREGKGEINISSGVALANGMPKTKHITAKKVTLMSIELAMMNLEMKCTLSVSE